MVLLSSFRSCRAPVCAFQHWRMVSQRFPFRARPTLPRPISSHPQSVAFVHRGTETHSHGNGSVYSSPHVAAASSPLIGIIYRLARHSPDKVCLFVPPHVILTTCRRLRSHGCSLDFEGAAFFWKDLLRWFPPFQVSNGFQTTSTLRLLPIYAYTSKRAPHLQATPFSSRSMVILRL